MNFKMAAAHRHLSAINGNLFIYLIALYAAYALNFANFNVESAILFEIRVIVRIVKFYSLRFAWITAWSLPLSSVVGCAVIIIGGGVQCSTLLLALVV